MVPRLFKSQSLYATIYKLVDLQCSIGLCMLTQSISRSHSVICILQDVAITASPDATIRVWTISTSACKQIIKVSIYQSYIVFYVILTTGSRWTCVWDQFTCYWCVCFFLLFWSSVHASVLNIMTYQKICFQPENSVIMDQIQSQVCGINDDLN